jgi:hypothetical protein
MPKANSRIPASNQVLPNRNPNHALGQPPKPELLDRLREGLRSHPYSRRIEFPHGLFHLTHIYLLRPEDPSPLAGEGGVRGIKMGNPIRPGSGRVAKNCKGDAKRVSKDGKGLAFDRD